MHVLSKLTLLIFLSIGAVCTAQTTVELFDSIAVQESLSDSLPQNVLHIRINNLDFPEVATIECIVADKSQDRIVFKGNYVISDLQSSGMLLNGVVTIPTGLLSDLQSYELKVARWSGDGNSFPLLIYELNN